MKSWKCDYKLEIDCPEKKIDVHNLSSEVLTEVETMSLSLVLVVVVVGIIFVPVNRVVYWLGLTVRLPIEYSTRGIIRSTCTGAEGT